MKWCAILLLAAGCATQVPPSPTKFVVSTRKVAAVAPAVETTITANVRWNPSSNATGYRVYFSPAVPYQFALKVETQITNVTITGLPWKQGYFHITATNQYGESK